MRGVRKAIANPYLDMVAELDPLVSLTRCDELCQRFAWAIPSEEAVHALISYGPIVEVFAGTGYWASLIHAAGGDIVAYDVLPGTGTGDRDPAMVRNERQARGLQEEAMNRTTCACKECVNCCKMQPGPLALGDFERIASYLGKSHEEAKAMFRQSRGALVRFLFDGARRWIGSITPKKRDGRCVFLNEDDRCSIHTVAPFGCSHFDMHLPIEEANRRSLWLARSMASDEYQELRNTLTQGDDQ